MGRSGSGDVRVVVIEAVAMTVAGIVAAVMVAAARAVVKG